MATTYTITWPAVVDQGIGPGIPAPFTLTLDSASVSSSSFSVTDGGAGGTFLPSAAPSIPAGQLAVTFTYKPSASTVDRSIPIAITNTAALIQPIPSSRTFTVTNFGYYRPTWEANMRDSRMLSYWAGLASPAPIANVQQTLMYDPVDIWEMIRAYTGDTSLDTQVAAALYQWRDMFVFPNGGGMTDYNNNTRGMRNNWVRTGDRASRAAVILQSFNCAYSSEGIALDAMVNQNASRPVAMGMMAMLDAEDCGCSRRTRVDHWCRLALGHCDQWLLPESSWPRCQWLQPFMVGITLRSLIEYWGRYRENGVDTTVTPNVPITGIPAKVQAMLDLLWTGSNRGIPYWFPDQRFPHRDFPAYPFADGTGYPLGPVGTGCFGYFYPSVSLGVLPGDCTNSGGDPVPSAVLSQYVAPACYWYAWYAATVLGDFSIADTYRRRGDAIFAGAQSSAPNQFNGLAAGKSFNENYFWSIPGVNWRDRVVIPPGVPTGLTATVPAPASGRAAAPSNPFRVTLDPPGSVPTDPVIVTPSVSGGGRTIPVKAFLTAERPTQAFRVVPASASAGTSVTVTTANDRGLPPASVSYTATAPAAATTTGYTVTPPANLTAGPHLYSDPFTVALAPAGSAPGTAADVHGGVVIIALGDNFGGGNFFPMWAWIDADRPSATYAYTPNKSAAASGSAPRNVISGNYIGYAAAPGTIFTPTPADFTMAGPAGGVIGTPSGPFTATIAYGTLQTNVTTNLPLPVTVDLADGGAGGTFAPASLSLSPTSPSAMFTYTAVGTAGTRSIVPTARKIVPTDSVPPYTAPAPTNYAATGAAAVPTGYLAIQAGGGYLIIQVG